jgi:hypothetical protein
MEIPYDQLRGDPFPPGDPHGCHKVCCQPCCATFIRPLRLPLYDASIADDATTVICVCAESAHQAKLNDCASFEAAKRGAAKFLCGVIDEVWYNDLKDADTFYTKVMAHKTIAFLDATSKGLHTIDMISLHTNMHHYYTQADDIPQYIKMLEDAQKKSNAGWHAHRQC